MQPKDHYIEHGYAVIRGFWDADEVAELDALVSDVYESWAQRHGDSIFENKLVNMHSLTLPEYFKLHPTKRLRLFELIASDKLTHLLHQMFGAGVYFHNTQLFFNPSNPLRLPYWHRDMQYSACHDEQQREAQGELTCLHIRIPLVAEQSLQVIPGTHQRWDTEAERNVRFELNGRCQSDDLEGAKTLPLDVGDIVIFDAQMIHRAVYEGHATRKALDLCVGKSHRLTAPFLDNQVLPHRAELEAIEYPNWYSIAYDVINRQTSENG